MFLNTQQFLGSQCSDQAISEDAVYSGNGALRAGFGYWQVDGIGCGYAHNLYGAGYVSLVGDIVGYASGLITSGPLDFYGNGLPYLTYSGNGTISGSDVVHYFPRPGDFDGRNAFFATSSNFSGLSVPIFVSGATGTTCLSGKFSFYGYLDNFTGSVFGTGQLSLTSDNGSLVRLPNPAEPVLCSGCSGNYLTSGDFQWTGRFSGNGLYRTTLAYVGLSPVFLSGGGHYFNLEGSFGGYSKRPFWGFGDVTGSEIYYQSGSYHAGLYQSFWGSGYFAGAGWIRGESGTYWCDGSAKGDGYFMGDGYATTLLQNQNLIYGSGCVAGVGRVFLTDSGLHITGAQCRTSPPIDPHNLIGCGHFPPYITNCSVVGSLLLDFESFGGCVVQGAPS